MSSQQETDSSDPGEKLAYESSNGDRWYLSQDPATGLPAVKHVVNLQSGGHVSFRDIESFLSDGNGPEHRALHRLLTQHLATILIAYDIHPAMGSVYQDLIEAIQSIGAWWHHLETVWIVRSKQTPEELRDRLKTYIGPDDQLLVLDITGCAAWAGVSESGNNWLNQNIDQKSPEPTTAS
jgi:hypothetical protein